MPIPGLSRIAVKFALALSAGALFAFGLGYFTSQIRGMIKEIDQKGYERGASDLALKYASEADALRKELEAKASAREDAIEAQRRQSEQRAIAAEKRATDALKELIASDSAFAQCEAQNLPDSVRKHFPRGVLQPGETITADSPNS